MKIVTQSKLWNVFHEHYATDRYELGTTVVMAKSAEEARNKLNAWLATKPDGVYTSLDCTSVSNVHQLTALE